MDDGRWTMDDGRWTMELELDDASGLMLLKPRRGRALCLPDALFGGIFEFRICLGF